MLICTQANPFPYQYFLHLQQGFLFLLTLTFAVRFGFFLPLPEPEPPGSYRHRSGPCHQRAYDYYYYLAIIFLPPVNLKLFLSELGLEFGHPSRTFCGLLASASRFDILDKALDLLFFFMFSFVVHLRPTDLFFQHLSLLPH